MTDDGDVRDPLPVDSDLAPEGGIDDEAGHVSSARRRRPDVDPLVVLAIFVGGFFGGAARYLIGDHWSTSAGGFPWPTFVINVSGAFVLALLLVLVIEVFPPTRYLRPALGTGFLGAYTTFSSLVVATDQLAAHHHLATAALYSVGSTAAGLVLAVAGLALGRWIARRA
jgi:CrcB protein